MTDVRVIVQIVIKLPSYEIIYAETLKRKAIV